MAVIYKATNKVNGKSYIGFASNFEERQIEHRRDSDNKKRGYHFHRAIRKYGWDNFEWTILKEDATTEDEISLIEQHDTYRNGYNCTKGGDGTVGHICSEDTKKISESNIGRKWSEEQRKRISEKRRSNGRKITPEHARKLHEGRKNSKNSESHILALKTMDRSYCKTTEFRLKQKEMKTGFVHTEETKRKTSESVRQWWAKRKMEAVT